MVNLYYVIVGFAGGVLGGMGMGSGTILIPLLTFIFNLSINTSKAINLISFIPMAIVSLLIHIKNSLIRFEGIIFIIILGLVSCFVFCFIAKNINNDILKRIFGCFLVILSVLQVVTFKKG